MIFRLIAQEQQKAPTTRLYRLFGVSRSGYCAARRGLLQPTKSCRVAASLKALFMASGRTYGSRRLQAALKAQGIQHRRYRIRQLMKKHQLRPTWKRKFVHTTDSKHDLPIAANVLNRQFNPKAANRDWAADITYIRTRRGWLYLAAVMDLFSRKIVDWSIAPNMPAELVCSALQMAVAQRQPAAGLIVHSDRGSQYASAAHRAVLAQHGLVMSMSRKGNYWDIKVPPGHASSITGTPHGDRVNWESLDLLLASGVAHEVRTTVHWQLLDTDALGLLARGLHERGVQRLVVPLARSEHMLDPSLGPSLTPQDWPQLREQLCTLFQHFEVRGAS